MKDHIKKSILSSIVHFMFKEIEKHSDLLKIQDKNKNKQETLINLLKNKNIDSNTVIGHIQTFWKEDNPNMLKEYLGDIDVLSFNGDYHITYVFDKNSVYFNVKDVNVSFEPLTQAEINARCKINEDGEILYNVTNDIYIPFGKEEINEHVRDTYKKVHITATIEFDFKNISGCGIKTVKK